MLNHQFLDGWTLLQQDPNNPQNAIEEPVDITDRYYQFRFFVEPNIEKMVSNVIFVFCQCVPEMFVKCRTEPRVKHVI